jgi:hypothetical protein
LKQPLKQYSKHDAKRIKLHGSHHEEALSVSARVGDKCNDPSKRTSESTAAVTGEGSDDIRSYIVRLLHDQDFVKFVNKIEKSLSTPDCYQMLKALEYPRPNNSK